MLIKGMRMEKIILLLSFTIIYTQDFNPCEDMIYIDIKKKKLDEMSDREYNYFITTDKECKNFLRQNKDISKASTTTSSKTSFNIENLLDKKWLLKSYIVDDKFIPIEKERKNDYYILKSNNQKEEVLYGKSIEGSWEFLPYGSFIMFYSKDMKTYVPVRIIELTSNTFKFVIFDIKSMKLVTLTYSTF